MKPQVYYNKGLCTKGDIYMYQTEDGKFSSVICNVDYDRIAYLSRFVQNRNTHDKRYFDALNELKKEMFNALQWEK